MGLMQALQFRFSALAADPQMIIFYGLHKTLSHAIKIKNTFLNTIVFKKEYWR